MLEFALVFVPFFALCLAIVDYSLPIFLRSTFMHAVREGCRFGVTYRLAFEGVTHSSQTAAIKAVVQHHAMGFLNGEENLDKIHVRYFQPEAPFAEVSGPGANASGNLLQVSIDDYEWEWIAPLWRTRSPLSINAISADRLETLPAGAPVPTP